MTPAEAGALARDAGADVLVLSHLWVEDDPFRAVERSVADLRRSGRTRHTRTTPELASRLKI